MIGLRDAPRISDVLLERARGADILTVAQQDFGAKLRKSRADWLGACPGGCAKNDGFVVSPNKGRNGIFLCRPSRASGDVVAMAQHLAGLSFADAIIFITGATREGDSGHGDRKSGSQDAAPKLADLRKESQPATLSDLGVPKTHAALALWREGVDPRGTLVERYLAGRGLQLEDDVAGSALRWHAGIGALLALFSNIRTDEPQAISRTFLDREGRKIERKFLGLVGAAAVKLDADDAVLGGLHVGEGVETCLAARQLGLRPCWALGSAGAIAAFPVLAGVECLTLLAENDDASRRATEACAARWHAAGREVLINRSTVGSDLADAIRGRA